MKKLFLSALALSALAVQLNAQVNLIPLPDKMVTGEGKFLITGSTALYTNEKSTSNLDYFRSFLSPATGYSFEIQKVKPSVNSISLELMRESGIPEEGYVLEISATEVSIKGSSEAGLFYGGGIAGCFVPVQLGCNESVTVADPEQGTRLFIDKDADFPDGGGYPVEDQRIRFLSDIARRFGLKDIAQVVGRGIANLIDILRVPHSAYF